MEKSLKECLNSERNEEIITKGLICNPVEGLTKTGKPYVDLTLYANGLTMPAKVWDMGFEEMMERYHLVSGGPVKVHGTVSVNPLSGEKQLCLRDGDIPAITPLDLSEEEIKALSQATPIGEDEMIKSISTLIEGVLPKSSGESSTPEESERNFLRNIADWAMERIGNTAYYPYGENVHKEKGGLLAHIYNACHKLCYMVGTPPFDKKVVLAALLSYRLGITMNYIVDNTTGVITENRELYEYGSQGQLCSDYILNWCKPVFDAVGTDWGVVRNYMATIKCLNGLCEPVSVEAAVAKTIADSELEVYRVYEATKGIEGDAKGFVKDDGSVRVVYKF